MSIQTSDIMKVITEKRSRRAALKGMGLGAMGLGAFGLLGNRAEAAAPGHDSTDVNILNFALNLEYLEAQCYSYATTGAGLAADLTGTGTQGTVTIKTNPIVPFGTAGDVVEQYGNKISQDETAHVLFLRVSSDCPWCGRGGYAQHQSDS